MLRFWSVAPEAKSSSFQPLVRNPLLRNWTADGLCRGEIKRLLNLRQTERQIRTEGKNMDATTWAKIKPQWEIKPWTKTKTSSNKQLNHEWRRPVVLPELENWMGPWKPNKVFTLAFKSLVSQTEGPDFYSMQVLYIAYCHHYCPFAFIKISQSIYWIFIRNSHFPIMLYTF